MRPPSPPPPAAPKSLFDDADDRPSKRGRSAVEDDDDEDDRPRRRRVRDEDDEDDRPARRRKPKAKQRDKPQSMEGKVFNGSVMGGALAMIIAVVWFIAGLFADIVFFYPPILFVIGLIGFIRGLVAGGGDE